MVYPSEGEGALGLPILPLTSLARDILKAVLDGRQVKGRKLVQMLGNGLVAWFEQRRHWLKLRAH